MELLICNLIVWKNGNAWYVKYRLDSEQQASKHHAVTVDVRGGDACHVMHVTATDHA